MNVKANVAGIVVMVLAMYGAQVTPEQHADLVGFFGTLGCLINLGLAIWSRRGVK